MSEQSIVNTVGPAMLRCYGLGADFSDNRSGRKRHRGCAPGTLEQIASPRSIEARNDKYCHREALHSQAVAILVGPGGPSCHRTLAMAATLWLLLLPIPTGVTAGAGSIPPPRSPLHRLITSGSLVARSERAGASPLTRSLQRSVQTGQPRAP